LDAILAGQQTTAGRPLARPPRLAVPRNYLLADLEGVVDATFDRTVGHLSNEGAKLIELEVPELDGITELNAGGGFTAAEAFAWHHDLIVDRGADYDPRVLVRIQRGAHQTARDLLTLHERRGALIRDVRDRLDGFDAFICPTVPLVAPPIDALEDDDEYTRTNMLMLRNPAVVNLLDGCAVSIPMQTEDDPPMGLMVAGFANEDIPILRVAAWIEEHL
jgi:aspartyl-tRNA(Asn)/glutamyl-tRNA(Gln) amidotransferase subunit A